MRTRGIVVGLLLGLTAAVWPTAGIAAGGNDFDWTVTTLSDGPGSDDATPGDGLCATGGGVCTLRAALQESAHASYAPDDNHHVRLPAGRIDLATPLGIFGSGTTELLAPAAGATVLSGQNVGRVLDIPGTGDVVLHGVDVTQGVVADAGGLVTVADGGRLQVRGARLTDGTAAAGGAISGGLGSIITLEDTVMEDNVAQTNGGGAVQTAGSLVVRRSAFLGNSAGYGGAVYVLGGGGHNANVDVENATFADNTASLNASALRIDQADAGDIASVRHITVVGNTTVASGGALMVGSTGTKTLHALVLDANAGDGCFSTGIATATASVSDDASCGFADPGSANATDPLLGAVSLHGGTVPVAMPAAGSPVLGRVTACLTDTDARNYTRLTGTETACDAGAAERILTDLRATLTAPATAAVGETVAFTAGARSISPLQIVPETQFRVTPADGVEIVDFDAAAPGVPSCTRVGAELLCDVDEGLLSDYAIGVRARRATAGPLALTVTATSATIDETPADNVATGGPVVVVAPGTTTPPGGGGTGGTPSGGTAPVVLPRITLVTVKRAKRTGRYTTTFRLSASARVTLKLERRVRRAGRTRYVKVTTITRSLAAGRRSIVLPAKVSGRRLARGVHRVSLQATDAAGRRGTVRRKSFSVR